MELFMKHKMRFFALAALSSQLIALASAAIPGEITVRVGTAYQYDQVQAPQLVHLAAFPPKTTQIQVDFKLVDVMSRGDLQSVRDALPFGPTGRSLIHRTWILTGGQAHNTVFIFNKDDGTWSAQIGSRGAQQVDLDMRSRGGREITTLLPNTANAELTKVDSEPANAEKVRDLRWIYIHAMNAIRAFQAAQP